MPDFLLAPPDLPPSVSEARLSSVLDTAVDGIIVADEQGRIMLFNHACERLFGYAMSEVVGENMRLLMPDDYASEHDQYLANYHASGMRRIIGTGREVRGRHRDGTIFPIELSVGETVTPAGRQYIGILRDLRPRHAVEARLDQLQADLLHLARVSAMDEMGATLAHEVNQPLTAVIVYLQAAIRAGEREGAPIPPASREIIDKAVREAERAAAIIVGMRRFIEKRDPERRMIALTALVDDAVDLTLLGQVRAVRVARHYAPPGIMIFVDPVQIQQIIVNLMRNALDAIAGQPRQVITIRTAAEKDAVVISVADSGPGIDEAVLPTLFKAFATTKRTGMGLGLAISRTIAQNHGGDLYVETGGEEGGAVFHLRLPLPLPQG